MVTTALKESSTSRDSAAEVAVTEILRYVARQPILDLQGQVHGYELLFRRGATSLAFDGDGDLATRTVLDNTLIFGMDQLTGGLPMFVNCTREALLGGFVKVLPPEYTVLELLETLKPDEALLSTCRELKSLGYRIALDDFAWNPEWQPLVEIADYIKVDRTLTTSPQRASLRARVGGRPIRLILERVETHQEFVEARSEGFELFQGFYFCRPQVIENRDVPANRIVHLQIMQEALKRPLDVKRISALVKRDPSLTYRLLRMVNSPVYAMRQVVSSIQGAVVMVGDEMFRRVVMLAITSELKGSRPTELLRMAFVRGRFCELAAKVTGQDSTEQYLLGMLSLLPAMLNVPMEKVAKALPLRREVYQALMGEGNSEQIVLNWLMYCELGRWEDCDRQAREAALPDAALARLYGEAVLWAEANLKLAIG